MYCSTGTQKPQLTCLFLLFSGQIASQLDHNVFHQAQSLFTAASVAGNEDPQTLYKELLYELIDLNKKHIMTSVIFIPYADNKHVLVFDIPSKVVFSKLFLISNIHCEA